MDHASILFGRLGVADYNCEVGVWGRTPTDQNKSKILGACVFGVSLNQMEEGLRENTCRKKVTVVGMIGYFIYQLIMIPAPVETLRMNDLSNKRFESDIRKNPETLTKKVKDYIFKFSDVLGKGSFSTVYKGYHQITHTTVAIKVVELKKINTTSLNELLKSEIEILQNVNHPNILHCYDVYFSASNCYIITQYCNGGNLKTYLSKKDQLDEKEVTKTILEVYEGLKYLGEKNIIHRDLKASNILMNDGQIKIADFGFAKKTRQSFRDINIGSPLYMSPEGILENIYGPKTDVWAFGIFIYELTHRRNPYHFCSAHQELQQAILQPITELHLKPDLSPELKAMILDCLQIDPQKRVSMKQIEKSDCFMRLKSQNRLNQNIPEDPMDEKQDSRVSTNLPVVQSDHPIPIHRPSFLNEVHSFQNRQANGSKQGRTNRSLNYRHQSLTKRKTINTPMDQKYNTSSKIKLPKPEVPKCTQSLRQQNSVNNLHIGRTSKLCNERNGRAGVARFSCDTKDVLRNQGKTESWRLAKVIKDVSQFQDLVALVHYCRILFKTIKISEKNVLLNIKTLSGWLFQILSEVQENIDRIKCPSLNIQDLKRITVDYQSKYSQQLVFSNRNHTTIQSVKSTIHQVIRVLKSQYMSTNKETSEINSHMAFLLQLTQLLEYSIASRNYKYFTENNKIECFLSGKNLKQRSLSDLLV